MVRFKDEKDRRLLLIILLVYIRTQEILKVTLKLIVLVEVNIMSEKNN